MEKAIPLTLIVIMSLAVLLTDCGNSKQAENASKSSSAAQMEDTSSSKAKASSALEASEPDIVPEEPDESDSNTAPKSVEIGNGQFKVGRESLNESEPARSDTPVPIKIFLIPIGRCLNPVLLFSDVFLLYLLLYPPYAFGFSIWAACLYAFSTLLCFLRRRIACQTLKYHVGPIVSII